jgi:hypothetical protein
MAETEFDLSYEGDALADGRMAVRDLAPALLALGEIFADASALIEPGRPPAALDIKATSEGSFVVHLIVGGWDHLVTIFSGRDADALVVLKESVVGALGLFALIKRLFGRRITATVEGPEPGAITLTLDDQTSLTVPADVFKLYGNIEVRKKAREVVEPLAKPGVEALAFRQGTDLTVRITSDEVPAFAAPAVEETPLGANETEMVLSITTLAFTEGNKWRLTDGTRTFYATIRDEAFIDRIDRGAESFRKGDLLRCRVLIQQSSTPGSGLHTEYEVLPVLEHIPRPVQLQFGDDSDVDTE